MKGLEMTKITDPNTGGIATPELLAAFEEVIEARLPEDYKAFVLSTNGGTPFPDTYIVNDGEEEWESNVFFYGLQTGHHSLYSLPTNYEEYAGRIPSGLIPIGNDYGGNLICISVTQETYGQIFFSHHDYFSYNDEEPCEDGTYFVAPSFSAFFDNLFEGK
jgi:hypothetical protein